jgi:ferrous iron transport protein B
MRTIKVALVGNPNSGKSTLFNYLTGLNQKVGNFPGVTVDRQSGRFVLDKETDAVITDLPGVYSIYPKSIDERIVAEFLLNRYADQTPDKVVVVADATNLKRSLLLLTQVTDMGLPTILVLNMIDLVDKSGIKFNVQQLSKHLGVPVVATNARNGLGIDRLKHLLLNDTYAEPKTMFSIWTEAQDAVRDVKQSLNLEHDYAAYLYLEQPASLVFLSQEKRNDIQRIRDLYQFFPGKFQGAETIQRYANIQKILDEVIIQPADESWKNQTSKLDHILTHRVWGYLIFFLVLTLIFQAIFAWASIPMDWIDGMFGSLSQWAKNALPEGPLTSLLSEGIIPGLGGIVIFIPQIAILFAFISMLEESGYMARVVFLTDKLMRKVGLNGKSVVPLMSGVACAIPAIMATRTIENWKERIITIMVTPLMSCSARLPIYTILIALIVPEKQIWGILNLQGLVLMSLYILGFVSAIIGAWIMDKILKVRERGFLIMEMPAYKIPVWKNVGINIVEKTQAFVWQAGKIILAISILLWVLSSYGPGNTMENAEQIVLEQANEELSEEELSDRVASFQLEHSYAGILGKAIEPVIKPLGYDWKIGIALLTSFAAREVFVGTIATLYSVGSSSEDENTIKERLQKEINPSTGQPMYTVAVGSSLLIFYAFAMQCMSTLAVVYRETKGWKWPIIQFIVLSVLAYTSAFLVYQVLS